MKADNPKKTRPRATKEPQPAYVARMECEEGHFLLGGCMKWTSYPYETERLAKNLLDTCVQINEGCSIPMKSASVRPCLTRLKPITEKEVYGTRCG